LAFALVVKIRLGIVACFVRDFLLLFLRRLFTHVCDFAGLREEIPPRPLQASEQKRRQAADFPSSSIRIIMTTTTQCTEFSPRLPKKPRLDTTTTKKTEEETVLESHGLLQAILSYLPDTFRFTAAVNHKFRQAYLSAHGLDNKRTSVRNALQTISTARIWATDERSPREQRRRRDLCCDWAARYGTLAVLQDLYLHGKHGWSSRTCEWAAARGQLETLIWARNHGCRWNETTYARAAENGHVNVLIWSRNHGYPMSADICAIAAENGHLDVLIWARENDCPWNRQVCTLAAEHGHLDVLVWAREHGCDWNISTCAMAAQGGHLDVLVWAREHGCPWDATTCTCAVSGGHLDVLVWAREHGCDWNTPTCGMAAQRGHLDILIWAREHDCPWNVYTCIMAAMYGHLNVLIWACEHGCDWADWAAKLCIDLAQSKGHLDVVEWIRQRSPDQKPN
jgi:hypothetical protein